MKIEFRNQSEGLNIIRTLVHPDPPTYRVAATAQFVWPEDATVIVRLAAKDGEHITIPWWAVLRPDTGEPLDRGFRRNIRVINERFLFGEDDDPEPHHALGRWLWSWYFVNDGETSSEDIRLEVGFVATAMHPPAL